MGPAREWLEDGRVEVRWDARTAVFNFEPQTAVQEFRAHADATCLLLSHVPDGITYEVLQDAGENGTATSHVHPFVGLDDEGDSLLLCNVSSIRCDIFSTSERVQLSSAAGFAPDRAKVRSPS